MFPFYQSNDYMGLSNNGQMVTTTTINVFNHYPFASWVCCTIYGYGVMKGYNASLIQRKMWKPLSHELLYTLHSTSSSSIHKPPSCHLPWPSSPLDHHHQSWSLHTMTTMIITYQTYHYYIAMIIPRPHPFHPPFTEPSPEPPGTGPSERTGLASVPWSSPAAPRRFLQWSADGHRPQLMPWQW